jgi:hypothetical protein
MPRALVLAVLVGTIALALAAPVAKSPPLKKTSKRPRPAAVLIIPGDPCTSRAVAAVIECCYAAQVTCSSNLQVCCASEQPG